MAGLAFDGANPDVSLLYDINGLAKDAPSWLDRAMAFVGEYGILLGLVLVVLWCWWSVRRGEDRQSAVASVAGIVWAPLAAGIAVLVNIPIRGFVERPRPFLDHKGLEVLVAGKTDFSFVCDHATLAMALGGRTLRRQPEVRPRRARARPARRVLPGLHGRALPDRRRGRLRARHRRRAAPRAARPAAAHPGGGGRRPLARGSAAGALAPSADGGPGARPAARSSAPGVARSATSRPDAVSERSDRAPRSERLGEVEEPGPGRTASSAGPGAARPSRSRPYASR